VHAELYEKNEHSEAPTTLIEYAQRLLTVAKTVRKWYEMIVREGGTLDLTPYEPYKSPQASGGGGKQTNQGSNPKQNLPQPNPTNRNSNPPAGKQKKKQRCILCNNNPFHVSLKGDKKKQCHLKNKTCVNKDHPDLVGHDWNTPFLDTQMGLDYKKIGMSWINHDKKINPTKTALEKMVNLHILSLRSTTNELIENLSPQHISEQQRSKPTVALELQHEGGSHRLQALIDPASYNDKVDETEIISYIAKPVAKFILDKYPNSLITCSCKPATTCTVAGCFTSNKCLRIKCHLSDEQARIENVEIAFRVVETLGSNDIIIGLSVAFS
jgi:hypothetical protein